ncbi:MAG TPA: T9SS type A sorting domain-containing protein [Flavipsychrobacter sp.]|nr:T9SS type A sorting domain-containing protein [Flavipsychrobacter sp.]
MRTPIKTIIILLLSAPGANAQPVIQDYLPSYGFGTTIYVGTNITNPGGGGANVTWDFSFQSSFNFVGNLEYIDIDGTEFESDFLTCNLVARRRMSGDTTYTYFTDLGSQLIINGENMGAVNAADYTNNPKVLFNFPMNYGDSLSDNWQNNTNSGRVKRYYDGWGTLITYFRPYNNVARIKTIDSTLVGSNWNVVTSYTWYTTDTILPIAFYHVPSQQMTILRTDPLSVKNVAGKNVVQLASNPLREQSTLYIDQPAPGMKLVISNAMGQVVREQNVTGNKTIIDRGNLSSGMYFYQVVSPRGIHAKGKLAVE